MPYEVLATEEFLDNVTEASTWLYVHNEMQSQDFADQKKAQLEAQINSLKNKLSRSPFSVGREVIPHFPLYRSCNIYGGRYQPEWVINESKKHVTLLRLKDLKYPAELRYKQVAFPEDDEQ